MQITHLHHGIPGTVVSQLSQPVDEALAGLTVDPVGLHHGLALLHELDHTVSPHESRWQFGQILEALRKVVTEKGIILPETVSCESNRTLGDSRRHTEPQRTQAGFVSEKM